MTDTTAVTVIPNKMDKTLIITMKTTDIIHLCTHAVVPTTLMMTRMMVIIMTMIIMKRNMMNVLRGMTIIMLANPGVAPLETIVDVGPSDVVVTKIDMKWLLLVHKISPSTNKIK